MSSLASYCWIKSKPVVMLDTSVKEHLSYSSARLSESALWKMTLKADSGPWLTVGGKHHTGGEVLMVWKSCSLWSLSPGQSEKQSANSLLLTFLYPQKLSLVGCFVDTCTYIYMHYVLNTSGYQCCKGRSIPTVSHCQDSTVSMFLGMLSPCRKGCCAMGFKPALTGYCMFQLFNLIFWFHN